METKIADISLQKSKVSSEKIASHALSMCCFPGNDASGCCSPHASNQTGLDNVVCSVKLARDK